MTPSYSFPISALDQKASSFFAFSSSRIFLQDPIILCSFGLYSIILNLKVSFWFADNELGMNILHFDHHETNVYASKYAFSTVEIQRNGIGTCGTELFYLYLKENNLLKDNALIKRFIEDTRAYDNWDWVKNNNVEANDLNKLFSIVGIDNYISKMVDKLRNNNKDIFDETEKYLIELHTQEENELICIQKNGGHIAIYVYRFLYIICREKSPITKIASDLKGHSLFSWGEYK